MITVKKLSVFEQSQYSWWSEDGHHRTEHGPCYTEHGLREQFGVSINVWRLAGDTLNINCNFLYCNHQVHRDFLITLYIVSPTVDPSTSQPSSVQMMHYTSCLNLANYQTLPIHFLLSAKSVPEHYNISNHRFSRTFLTKSRCFLSVQQVLSLRFLPYFWYFFFFFFFENDKIIFPVLPHVKYFLL
jgi:hypothetical protein